MLGSVIEHHLMGRVMQKDRAAFHRLQDAALAFDAQRLQSHPLALSYPAHQRFRLMDIQIVQDQMPLGGGRAAFNQALEVRVGPEDGSMTCPVTTSKLRNQDNVPWRMYSNSRRST